KTCDGTRVGGRGVARNGMVGEGQGRGADKRAAVWGSIEHDGKGGRTVRRDEVRIGWRRETIRWRRAFEAGSDHELMPQPQGMESGRLPKSLQLLPSLDCAIGERRGSRYAAPEQFDAAL